MSRDAMMTAAVAFAVVGLATVSLALLWEWVQGQRRSATLRRQLDAVRNPAGKGEDFLFRGAQASRLDPLVSLAQKFGPTSTLEMMLVQAGMRWDVGSFLVTSLGVGAAAGMVTLLLTRSLVVAVAAAALGAMCPYIYVRRRRLSRISAFEEHLPEALDLLGRAVRAGHPISSGIQIVADEAAEPIAGEFQRSFEEQRFGLPFDDSMLAMSRRMPLIDLQMMVTAILIQREVGGNLAEVLDNLADVIRQRFNVRRQLRTYTAQGRMSGYILAVLPIAVGCAIYLINPPYVQTLFQHPLGRLMLGIAVTMQLIGFFWIRQIVDIEI